MLLLSLLCVVNNFGSMFRRRQTRTDSHAEKANIRAVEERQTHTQRQTEQRIESRNCFCTWHILNFRFRLPNREIEKATKQTSKEQNQLRNNWTNEQTNGMVPFLYFNMGFPSHAISHSFPFSWVLSRQTSFSIPIFLFFSLLSLREILSHSLPHYFSFYLRQFSWLVVRDVFYMLLKICVAHRVRKWATAITSDANVAITVTVSNTIAIPLPMHTRTHTNCSVNQKICL